MVSLLSSSISRKLISFRRPEFPDDVWEATYEKWREQFGDDWEKASAILDAFEAIDVYMLDPNPHNFRFR